MTLMHLERKGRGGTQKCMTMFCQRNKINAQELMTAWGAALRIDMRVRAQVYHLCTRGLFEGHAGHWNFPLVVPCALTVKNKRIKEKDRLIGNSVLLCIRDDSHN